MTTHNFSVKRGETWPGMTCNVLDGLTPLDITDADITMQVKKESCSDTVVVEFSTTSGTIVITDPTGGTFEVSETVFDILPKDYYYDIYIVTSDGKKRYIIDPSILTITENVTRL